MNNKWIAFAAFVWIIGMFLGSTFEQHTGTDWAGASDESTLEYLLDVKNITYQQDIVGGLAVPMFNTDYFSTMWKVMTFDFEFFSDDVYPGMEIVRWIILLPIALAIAYGILYAFIQLLQGFIPFT